VEFDILEIHLKIVRKDVIAEKILEVLKADLNMHTFGSF
jgi:hypothetical protein